MSSSETGGGPALVSKKSSWLSKVGLKSVRKSLLQLLAWSENNEKKQERETVLLSLIFFIIREKICALITGTQHL